MHEQARRQAANSDSDVSPSAKLLNLGITLTVLEPTDPQLRCDLVTLADSRVGPSPPPGTRSPNSPLLSHPSATTLSGLTPSYLSSASS